MKKQKEYINNDLFLGKVSFSYKIIDFLYRSSAGKIDFYLRFDINSNIFLYREIFQTIDKYMEYSTDVDYI